MNETYVRNAILLRVIDGDTVDLRIDLGFRVWIEQRVRLLGVDCPEMTGPTRAAGMAAKTATEMWFRTASAIVVQTVLDKRDGFGRVLARICKQHGDRGDLSQWLLDNGYAVPYV